MVEQGQGQADVALPPRKRLLAGLKQQNGWIPGSSPSPSPSSTLQAPPTPASAADTVEELPPQTAPPSSPSRTPQCSSCGARESQDWKKMRLGDMSMLLCTLCGVRVLKKKYCPHCYVVYQEDVDLTDETKWLGCSDCKRRVHSACEEKINGAPSGQKPFLCVDCSSDRPLPHRAVLTRARTSGGRQGANASGAKRGVSQRTGAVLGLRPSRPDHVDVVDLPPPIKKPRTASVRDGDLRSRDQRGRTGFAFHGKKDVPPTDGGLGSAQENRQLHAGGCLQGFVAPIPTSGSKGKGSSPLLPPPLPPAPASSPPVPDRNLLEAAAVAAKAAAESAVSAAAAAKAAALAKAGIAAKAAAAARAALDVAAKAARSEVRARAILRKYGDRFERELHSQHRAGITSGGRQEPGPVRGEPDVKVEKVIHKDLRVLSLEEPEKLNVSRADSVKEGEQGDDHRGHAELVSRSDQISKQSTPSVREEKSGCQESAGPQHGVAESGKEKVVKQEWREVQVSRELNGKRLRDEKGVKRHREEKARKRLRDGAIEKRVGEERSTEKWVGAERSTQQENTSERRIAWESKTAGLRKRLKDASGESKQSSDLKVEKQPFSIKEPGERKPRHEEKQGLQGERREVKQGKGIDRERKQGRVEGRERKPGVADRQEKISERKNGVSNGEIKVEKANARDEKEKVVNRADKGEEKSLFSERTEKEKGGETDERRSELKRPVLDKPRSKGRREEKIEGCNTKKVKEKTEGSNTKEVREKTEGSNAKEVKEKKEGSNTKEVKEKVEDSNTKGVKMSKKSSPEDGKRVLKDVINPGSVKASNPQAVAAKLTGLSKQLSSNGGDVRSTVPSVGVQRSSPALDDEELARQLHRAMNSSPRISGVDLPTRRRGRVDKQGLSKTATAGQEVRLPQQQCKESVSRNRCGLVRERSHIPGREMKRSESRISKSTGQSEEAVIQQATKDTATPVINGGGTDSAHASGGKAEKKGVNGACGAGRASPSGDVSPVKDDPVSEVSGKKGEENGPNAAMAALLNEVLKASPEEEAHLIASARISERKALEEKRKSSLEYIKKTSGMLDIANGGIVEKVNGLNGMRGYAAGGIMEKAVASGGKLMTEMKFKGAFSLGKLRPVVVGDVDAKIDSNMQSRVTVQTAGGPSPHYG